jgi:hypothetical protein
MEMARLDGAKLVDQVVSDLAVPGMTPVLAIERALETHLYQVFSDALSSILIKPPKVKFHSMYCGFHADSDTHSTHIRTVIPR